MQGVEKSKPKRTSTDKFAYLAAAAEHRLDQLRHAVTHLGSVDLSIDAARRFRKRIAAGRFDPAFAASGLIGLGAPLIVGTWRLVPAGTSTPFMAGVQSGHQ